MNVNRPTKQGILVLEEWYQKENELYNTMYVCIHFCITYVCCEYTATEYFAIRPRRGILLLLLISVWVWEAASCLAIVCFAVRAAETTLAIAICCGPAVTIGADASATDGLCWCYWCLCDCVYMDLAASGNAGSNHHQWVNHSGYYCWSFKPANITYLASVVCSVSGYVKQPWLNGEMLK